MTLRALLLLALTLAFAASPLFVTSFNGIDPNLYPVPQVDPPVQPAGWAFAIWGLIYLALILHGGFGLWRRAEAPGWDATRLPLAGSLALGSFWLAAAERSPVLATVMIWAMLGLAIWALLRAPAGRDPWLLTTPLALYAGWLTAASCAGLGLLGAGWGVGPGELGWAYLGIALASAIAVPVQLARPDAPAYGLAVAWALVAIAAKNLGQHSGVALAAGIAAAIVLGLAAAGALKSRATAPG